MSYCGIPRKQCVSRIKVDSWLRIVKPGCWEWRQCLVCRCRWEQYKMWYGVDHCFTVTAIWLWDKGLGRVQKNKTKLGAVIQRQEGRGKYLPIFSFSSAAFYFSLSIRRSFPPCSLISGGGGVVLVKSHSQ